MLYLFPLLLNPSAVMSSCFSRAQLLSESKPQLLFEQGISPGGGDLSAVWLEGLLHAASVWQTEVPSQAGSSADLCTNVVLY